MNINKRMEKKDSWESLWVEKKFWAFLKTNIDGFVAEYEKDKSGLVIGNVHRCSLVALLYYGKAVSILQQICGTCAARVYHGLVRSKKLGF